MNENYLSFPFRITESGRVASSDERAVIRERLEQILFTAPGERVMLPEFGCGVGDLVFVGNNPVLEAAVEFKIASALQRSMGRQVMINGVDVRSEEEKLFIEIVYTTSRELEKQKVAFEATPAGAGAHE